MTTDEVYGDLVKRLSDHDYLRTLKQLSDALGSELWLSGGWVRSAYLGQSSYVGDVDCLVELRPEDIEARLGQHGIKVLPNVAAGARVFFPDGNHCDLLSTFERGGDGSVSSRLMAFDASVNAIAIRLGDGAVIATPTALDDIGRRQFYVWAGATQPGERVDLLVKAQTLRDYYHLRPGNDEVTCAIFGEIGALQSELHGGAPEAVLETAGQRIGHLVPAGRRAWIVRGYVRCALSGSVCYWDDIDVVTNACARELFEHLDQRGIRYGRSLHGNPKLRMRSGQMVDIWSIEDAPIETHLMSSEFECDAVAWDVEDKALRDPLGAVARLGAGRLKAARVAAMPWPGSPEYLSIKAAYLCLRHALVPMDEYCAAMLRAPIGAAGFTLKHAQRLSRELACCCVANLAQRIESVREAVGYSPALDLLECALREAGAGKYGSQ